MLALALLLLLRAIRSFFALSESPVTNSLDSILPTAPGLAPLLGQIPLDLTLEMNLSLGLVSVLCTSLYPGGPRNGVSLVNKQQHEL